MKYIIKSLYNLGQMKLWPHDREDLCGDDRVFVITWEPSDEDAETMTDQQYLEAKRPTYLYIPASEFYQFMENIKNWAPDTRKVEEDTHEP